MENYEFQKIWDLQWQAFAKNIYLKINEGVVREILAMLNEDVKNKRILEVGAGSGSDVIALAKKGAVCVALDFSKDALNVCRKLAKQENVKVETILADCRQIPIKDDSFDLVFSVGLIEHFEDPIPVIKEQLRVLKKGGFLIIDVPQKYNLYTIVKRVRMKLGIFPFGWEMEYTVNGLKRIGEELGVGVVRFYGRESAFTMKLPERIKNCWLKLFSKLERSRLAPFICLNLGAVYQK